MRFPRILPSLAILAVAALPALAKPNFSGDWKMNPSKSDFGPMPAPSSMTEKIAHEDPNLTVAVKQATDQGDFEANLKYTTDGKECSNEVRGNPVKSTAKWDGDTLLIDSKAKFGDNDMTINDKWNLSEDGKTLTVSRHIVSPMGEGDIKMVLEKQ